MENRMEIEYFNHFEIDIPNAFKQLWKDKDFATVDDHQIRAHKVILSSCSNFFRNILLNNPHQNPLIYLKDIRYKELEMVMKFFT